MGLENFLQKVPSMTSQQWNQFSDLGAANSDSQRTQRLAEREAWMSKNGIAYNSGIVEVKIDGQKMRMRTDENNFGTMVDENDQDLRPDRPAHV